MRDGKHENHHKKHHDHENHHGHHMGSSHKEGIEMTSDHKGDFDSSADSKSNRQKSGAKAVVNPDRCTSCGKCVRVCPEDAISL